MPWENLDVITTIKNTYFTPHHLQAASVFCISTIPPDLVSIQREKKIQDLHTSLIGLIVTSQFPSTSMSKCCAKNTLTVAKQSQLMIQSIITQATIRCSTQIIHTRNRAHYACHNSFTRKVCSFVSHAFTCTPQATYLKLESSRNFYCDHTSCLGINQQVLCDASFAAL